MRCCIQLLAGIVAAGAAGCASSGSAWKATGYRQDAFGYEVSFRDAKTRSFAGPDWQLDNHHYDQVAHAWEEKTGNEYLAVRLLDWNHDGSYSNAEKNKVPLFDLKIVSKKNNGMMWIKAHPLLPENAEQELEVMFDNYVDALSGHGLYTQGNLFVIPKAKARSFTTFPASKEITKVGASGALTGTFEIAETDRIAQDPKFRSGVVKLVMVKVRCFTFANCKAETEAGSDRQKSEAIGAGASSPSPDADLARWPLVDCRGKPCRARTGLLVIGYYNTPAHFAASLPDLDDVLKRISFPDALPLPVPAPAAIAKTAAPAPPSESQPSDGDALPAKTAPAADVQ
jgi:hypothetical protein